VRSCPILRPESENPAIPLRRRCFPKPSITRRYLIFYHFALFRSTIIRNSVSLLRDRKGRLLPSLRTGSQAPPMSLRTSPQTGVAISCTNVTAGDCHVASLLAMTEGVRPPLRHYGHLMSLRPVRRHHTCHCGQPTDTTHVIANQSADTTLVIANQSAGWCGNLSHSREGNTDCHVAVAPRNDRVGCALPHVIAATLRHCEPVRRLVWQSLAPT
jgi:hypothetical protein